jgi:hypothetical protein
VNRRLVVAALVACTVTGGLAAPALAGSPENDRHKLCVLGPTPAYPNQEGICVTWVTPPTR